MEKEKLTHEQLDYIVTYMLCGVDRKPICKSLFAENAAKELLKAFILLWENDPEAFGVDSLHDRINNLHMSGKYENFLKVLPAGTECENAYMTFLLAPNSARESAFEYLLSAKDLQQKPEEWYLYGNKDHAAYATSFATYLILEKCSDGMRFIHADKETYDVLENGVMPQKMADIDVVADEFAKMRQISITGKALYGLVIAHLLGGKDSAVVLDQFRGSDSIPDFHEKKGLFGIM